MTNSDQDEKVQSLHDAYAGGDPNITAGVYDNWAAEYEAHMKGVGYTHPAMTAAMYTRHQPSGDAPMLDAGSGTGIMGEILPALGYPVIDGFDISPGMLALAEKKNLYRNLQQGALGERLGYADNTYAGATASGVFTEGHAPLPQLVPRDSRVAGVLEEAQVGPELPHAAGHLVGIALQLLLP